MNKPKKIPLRKCVATNNQFPKKEMFRIVRTPEGEIKVDLTGKLNGHGAYLSKSLEAIEIAKKKHILDKYLEQEVDNSLYDDLVRLLSDNERK